MSNYATAMMKLVGLYHGFVGTVESHLNLTGTKISAQQGLLLYRMTEAGRDAYKAGDLKALGIYNGSNAHYNVKDLITKGFIHSEKQDGDNRTVYLSITALGSEAANEVSALLAKQAKTMSARHVNQGNFESLLGQVGDGLGVTFPYLEIAEDKRAEGALRSKAKEPKVVKPKAKKVKEVAISPGEVAQVEAVA